MSTWKIIGGIVLGVGAVAAAPFTGGGSVLGAATLAGSLTGAAATAAGAGVVGGIAGAAMGEKEKEDRKRQNRNKYKEGSKAGANKTKQKFNTIIEKQKQRDKFMLLCVAIGSYVAKCDNEFHPLEKEELNNFIGRVNKSSTVPEPIRKEIEKITKTNISYDRLVYEVKMYLKKQPSDLIKKDIDFFTDLIEKIIHADNIVHEKENEFLCKWRKEFY